jgi:hypothetical protein
MFSATLGLSRGPSRRITLTQLSLLNIGAALVIGGRVFGSEVALALGATTVTLVVGWVLWLVDGLWRRSVNRRFAITGIFYRMAGASIVIGATIGGALGIGAIGDASSFVAYRNLHMTLNVLGWSGLTVVGTVITLLPTIIHVRAPAVGNLRAVAWLMLGGLTSFTTGGVFGRTWLSVDRHGVLRRWARDLGRLREEGSCHPAPKDDIDIRATSNRRTCVADCHCAGAGCRLHCGEITRRCGISLWWAEPLDSPSRPSWALGPFSFPVRGAPVPDRRRRELVAMELGGRIQVVAYNIGVIAVVIGLRSELDSEVLGTVLAWAAATWVLLKSWGFPLLATTSAVHRNSAQWWAAPKEENPFRRTN